MPDGIASSNSHKINKISIYWLLSYHFAINFQRNKWQHLCLSILFSFICFPYSWQTNNGFTFYFQWESKSCQDTLLFIVWQIKLLPHIEEEWSNWLLQILTCLWDLALGHLSANLVYLKSGIIACVLLMVLKSYWMVIKIVSLDKASLKYLLGF